MSHAVLARGLTRRFGAFTAVDNVDFTVERGTIFGFLGPNGAGKTTTIKMLNGLLAPSAGSAEVDGVDVGRDPDLVRSRIGYMSQKFSLYPDLTVAENIQLFAGLYGVAGRRFRERQAWIIEMAGLSGQERRLTGELSLGWKQRLALGCAVLHEPRVLFLDEPTSGVDPTARRAFWDLIDSIASAGTTVLVSTHYLEEAEHCHRLILMNRARIIARGAPRELRAQHIDPILEVRTDNAPAAVDALQGAEGVVEAAVFGRAVHVAVLDVEEGSGIVSRLLQQAGHPASRIQPVRPSLEDVFVALVRRAGGAQEG